MRILFASPYIISEWDNGKLVMKALSELGHHLILWDPIITPEIPSQDYDLAFVMKGLEVNPADLKSPKINWFPDDFESFSRSPDFKKSVDRIISGYDYVFTPIKSSKGIWVPFGCDPAVHKPLKREKMFDVVFIGTAHSEKRVKFIKRFMDQFKGKFAIFGNDWHRYNIKANMPQYFTALTEVMNMSRISLNLHGGTKGINTRISETAGCGSALLITDDVDGLNETYPMAPKFNSLEECLELTNYYLNNLRERRKLVKEMQKRAYEKFTYKHQVAKILKIVEEKLL